MVKPYYDDGNGIQIYLGDCRDVAPLIGRFDLLLTDPPYGINRDGSKASTSKHGGRKPYEFRGWDGQPPDCVTLKMLMDTARNSIVWGANYFPACLTPSMGWLVWDKGQRICGSDGELAYTSFRAALRIFTLNRVELMLDGAQHPTQKPEKLMLKCIAYAEKHHPVASIFDPYMGVGSTLVAAKLRGIKAVGIELSEAYCKIAVERLRQGVLIPC